MAAKKGKLFLLKAGSTTVASLRSTGLSISGELVDVTNKDSSGMREALAGAGITSVTFSGSGVWTKSTEQEALVAASLDNSETAYSIVDEDTADFTGNFIVTSFNMSGEFNGEQTFDVSLESSGVVAFTAGT